MSKVLKTPSELAGIEWTRETPVGLSSPAAHKRAPLKILFLNHNVVRGGGTYYRAFDVARYLVRRGHSVTLLSIAPESKWTVEREINQGVEIVHTPDLFWGIGRSGWDPWDTLVRTNFVRHGEWDVIHAWDCRPVVIFPALAARRFSKRHPKLIIDWCDWWGRGGTQLERGGSWVRYIYNAVETLFEEAFRRSADATTVISTALRDRAVKLGVDPRQIHLIPQGCDTLLRPSQTTRDEARATLGVASHDPIFITVGVLNTSDAALLFKTVPLVRAKMPRAKFYIIGKTRARAPAHLAGDSVEELGYVPDATLATYLCAANALVVPLADTLSSRARWPSKVNFALTYEVPVVVSRVGDLPRLLQQEGAAFVASPTPESLAETIMEAASGDADLAAIKAAAHRVATELLPWSKSIDELEALYYDVLTPAVE